MVNRSLAEISAHLIKYTEFVVFEVSNENKFGMLMSDLTLPIKKFKVGLVNLMQPIFYGFFIWFIILLAITFGVAWLKLPIDFLKFGSTLAIVIPLIFMILAKPSSYALTIVDTGKVKKIADNLIGVLGQNGDKVGLVLDAIELYELRIIERLKFYKILISGAWAFIIVYANIISKGEDGTESAISEVLALFPWVAVTWLVYASYKRSSDMLVLSIKFACKNAEFDLKPESLPLN